MALIAASPVLALTLFLVGASVLPRTTTAQGWEPIFGPSDEFCYFSWDDYLSWQLPARGDGWSMMSTYTTDYYWKQRPDGTCHAADLPSLMNDVRHVYWLYGEGI